MSLGYCRIPGCTRPVENKDTGLCATHGKAMRKIVQPSIRKTGEKLAKRLQGYQEAVRAFIRGKRCAVYPELKAEECHHMAGRSNDMLMNKKYWLAVSRKGHVYIELHPKEAKGKGWSISRLAKIDQSKPTII